MRCYRPEITRGPEAHEMKKWLLMSASRHEKIINAELLRFRYAPRRDPFTANPVLEVPFALSDQNLEAIQGECPRQRRAAKATADDDYVEVMLRHLSSPLMAARSEGRRVRDNLRWPHLTYATYGSPNESQSNRCSRRVVGAAGVNARRSNPFIDRRLGE
jgi:hypothetical protein